MAIRTRARASLLTALFARVITLLVIVIAVIGALAFWSAREQIGKSYDASLITASNVLYALMGEELSSGEHGTGQPLEVDDAPLLSAEDRAAFNAESDARMFRIWRGAKLAMSSDTGPMLPPPAADQQGFQNVDDAGADWRIYSLPIHNRNLVIQVGERSSVRGSLVHRIALDLAFPLLLLIPAAAGLVWLSLTDGLRLLRALSGEMRRRSLHDLSQLDMHHWPADLAPLIRSVNQLFERLEHAFQQERSFIDLAAHQLRTPLATIKLQTQLIAREADPAKRQQLVTQLESSVNRATALSDRLLTLARLEAESTLDGSAELSTETAAVLAEFTALAESRGVVLVLEAELAPVRCDPTLLRLIAANLIENAVRHAPVGGRVEVHIAARDTAVLVVADNGPGIAAADRRRVFDRFYRGAGEQVGGSGLGLAIVAEAVRILRGDVVLEHRPDGAAGLVVRVRLPLLSAAR